MPAGRPTQYNAEIANLICERVKTHDWGLKRLCEHYNDLPDKTTVNEWRAKHSEFATQYAKAKLVQADLLAEECLDIADDATSDIKFNELGQPIWDTNCINRARLRIDTRKWLAAKLLPKQYGAVIAEDNSKNSVIEKLLEKL